MRLPEHVARCIDALERAGFAAYAVGGCVRDSLLGLPPNDYDLCTAATPAQLRGIFAELPLVRAGEKHGTVGVVTDGGVVEITTFRAEGAYRDHRHPDWVAYLGTVGEDLARRDFTVNAIAYSPTRGFADPFGGRADLEKGVLRAVGDPKRRFEEDALRVLRGVRFAVKYRLTVEAATQRAMTDALPLVDGLARERVFSELCKLLPLVTAADLIAFSPVITQVIPELSPALGFDQHNPHHRYDVYTHIAHVTAAVPPELPLRFAALLHDAAKPAAFSMGEDGRGHFYGHAARSAELADAVLRRLRAPNALRERVTLLIGAHMATLSADRRLLRRRVNQYGAEAVWQLLALQRADFAGKGVREADDADFDAIEAALRAVTAEGSCRLRDLCISGHDLMELGFPEGPALGACLKRLLALVQEEALPNTRAALLAAAEEFLEQTEERI